MLYNTITYNIVYIALHTIISYHVPYHIVSYHIAGLGKQWPNFESILRTSFRQHGASEVLNECWPADQMNHLMCTVWNLWSKKAVIITFLYLFWSHKKNTWWKGKSWEKIGWAEISRPTAFWLPVTMGVSRCQAETVSLRLSYWTLQVETVRGSCWTDRWVRGYVANGKDTGLL